MHRIWETLAMLCLVHGGASSTTTHSANTSNSTDSPNRTLLNASSLWAHHIYASIICTYRIQTNWGVTFIGTAVVDPLVCLMLRVVAARGHGDCMLLWYMEVVIVWRCSSGSSAIYTIARCTTWDHNILTILERCCYICVNHCGIANLRIVLNHHVAVHVVLSTLVGAVRVWWMVWVTCWIASYHTSRVRINMWSCIVLLSLWKVLGLITILALSSIGLVILFTRLWADAS